MTKNVFYKFLSVIIAGLTLLSCEKWIDPDININPNAPSEVTMGTLLPSIEAQMAYAMCGGSDMIGIQSVWLQQLDGIAREFMALTNYFTDPESVNAVFDQAYSVAMMDAVTLIDLANKKSSPHNKGVAKICLAVCLAQLTDVFGDIPWSESLKGVEIPRPAYDQQESVYEEIFRLLEEAIHDLSETDEPIGIDGDYFYYGDVSLWLKAAHSLKARYSIHMTKRKGSQAYQDALNELNMAFTSNDDDMQFNYGPGESESSPLYQFMRDRDDVRMGAYFIEMLKSYNDPRLPVFAFTDVNGEYTGSEPGSGNTEASSPGPAMADAESPTLIMTYVECLFMKAEIIYQTDNDENLVREILIDAVTESLSKFGVYDEPWLSEYTASVENLTGMNLFEEVMTQKYIATFYQPEVYHSWRRTGYPVIPPNPLGVEDEIPRRFPYTSWEQIYNKDNVPKGVEITDRVWWDE